jgi:hypothetical protein
MVVDGDGQAWAYNWVFRGVYDKNLDFRPVVDFPSPEVAAAILNPR